MGLRGGRLRESQHVLAQVGCDIESGKRLFMAAMVANVGLRFDCFCEVFQHVAVVVGSKQRGHAHHLCVAGSVFCGHGDTSRLYSRIA
ncbi:hypothetical protein D3C81_816630 [compost metagenome]